MKIKIEKNIPMPEPSKRGKWKVLFSGMKVGDSFVVDTIGESMSISGSTSRLGFKSASRRLPNGKYRVWRIK